MAAAKKRAASSSPSSAVTIRPVSADAEAERSPDAVFEDQAHQFLRVFPLLESRRKPDRHVFTVGHAGHRGPVRGHFSTPGLHRTERAARLRQSLDPLLARHTLAERL